MTLGFCAWLTAAVATVLPLRPLWEFYHVPTGTVMRPMGLTLVLGLCAAIGFLIAMPLSLACLALGWRHRPARWVAALGIVFSLVAMNAGYQLFYWIVSARRFVLED